MGNYNAKKYDKLYNNREGEVNLLLKYLKGKTVLDIGSGTGIISEALNKKGFECVNIEPQEEMAEEAEKRGIGTMVIPAEHIGNFPKKFDNAIMVFDVFNFLKDPKEVLKRIAKNLKGVLVFRYWNYDIRRSGWDFNWKLKRISRKRWEGDKTIIDFWFPFWHERHEMKVYPHRRIKRWLHKNGFKIKEKIKSKFTTIIVAEICE